MPSDKVSQKLDALPQACGVYLMKDRRQKVIYVGKAVNLRSRVRSYFQPGSSDERVFVEHMVPKVADVDWVLVGSEKEALILENNLIKQFKPRFNINLKVVHSKGLLGFLGFLGSTQDRPDPGDHLARRERFGDIVIRSNFKPNQPVGFFHPGGEHDDGGILFPADFSGDIQPVHAREIEVKNYQVRVSAPPDIHPGIAAPGGEHLKSCVFKIGTQDSDQFAFVFDDQDGLHSLIILVRGG